MGDDRAINQEQAVAGAQPPEKAGRGDSMGEKTARERVLAAIRGQGNGIPPVISVCQYATYGLMEKTGAFWPEAHYDGEKMAQLAAGGATILHLDAVRVPYCQTVEAEAYGAKVRMGGQTHIPSIDKPAFTLGEEPVIPKHFLRQGRIPAVLTAIRRLKQQADGRVAVMGSLVGPFSVAASLVGISVLLKASYRHPEQIIPYLEAAEQTAEQYAQAMEKAGADVIVIEDMMASLDMISPRTYRSLAEPYEKQLIATLHRPVIIHICGKLDAVMTDIASTGANAISLESVVDIPAARQKFREQGIRVPIIGAVHPIKVLLEGSSAEVRQAVADSVAAGVELISPDCAVAPDTPIENLVTMTAAAHGESSD